MSEDLKAWYRKRHLLITLLGLSKTEAVFQKKEIEEIAADLRTWFKQAARYLVTTVVVIIAAAVGHSVWIRRPTRTAYFVAYAFGLAGTLMAVYGFAFHPKGLTPTRHQTRLISFPHPPRSDREFPHYAAELNRSLARYLGAEMEGRWQQVKTELRRQLALAIGMVLVAASFLMQMALQFVDP